MRKVLTLPAVSGLNTRVSGTNPLPASSGIVGIGVVGVMIVGQAVDATAKDARYVNCFKHVADGRTYCVKRSGLGVLSTPQAGSIGTALLVWTGVSSKVMSAFGGTNSSIYDGTTQLVTDAGVTTAITGKATNISETEVNGTATIYIPSTDSTAWYYQNGGTVTKIVDAQFPGNNSLTLAGFGAHLDGFTFQMDTKRQIWSSDLNSITSWTAAAYITASSHPGTGVGCVRWKEYIIGFCSQHMEFFRNAGNPPPGSPLTRMKDMTKKVGATHADAITQISDTIFFCGSTAQGGLSIYQFDGEVGRISPPEIDAVLLLAGAGNIKLTALRDLGLSFVLVKSGTVQYAYCIEEKFWFQWSSSLGFVRFAGLSTGTSTLASYGVSELSTSGKVYTINPSSRVFTDDSTPWSARWQLPTIDPANGDFVSYERVEIVGDVESSSSPLTLTWSDDDYLTSPNQKTLDLSSNVPLATRMGRTDKPRSFAGVHSAATPMRIEKLRLTVST